MEMDVVLYGLTTLRFESIEKAPGALRQFGYSKERQLCPSFFLAKKRTLSLPKYLPPYNFSTYLCEKERFVVPPRI